MKKLILVFVSFLLSLSITMAVPKASSWNGVCYAVKDYIEDNANDPDSIEYIECSGIIKFDSGAWGQRVKYRGKNAFGALVINERIFIMSGDEYKAKVVGSGTMSELDGMVKRGEVKMVALYNHKGEFVKKL